MSNATPSTTVREAAPVSSRRGWLAVSAVAIGSFTLVLSEFLPIGLLPSIAKDLHVSVGTAGLMVVATAVAGAIGAPLITVATSRLDRRSVLWGLSVLLVISDVVGSLAPNFTVLLAARLVLGLAVGGFWSIGAGVAARLVRTESAVRATSLITGGISLATVVSLPLGSFIAVSAGWRAAFVIGAALGVVAMLGQLLSLPRIPAQGRVSFSALGGLLKIRHARIGLIVTAFIFIGQFAAYTYITPYLKLSAHFMPGAITLGLFLFGVAGLAGNFAAGIALSSSVKGTLLVILGVLVLSVAALPFVASSFGGVIALVIIWGVVAGALPLGMQTWMTTASSAASEVNLAPFVTTIQVGIAGGSIVGALIVNSTGVTVAFLAGAGIALVGVLVLVAFGASSPRASRALASSAHCPDAEAACLS